MRANAGSIALLGLMLALAYIFRVLWAALIRGLTLLGFAPLMPGMLFVFPLLAHASWQAYRDVVQDRSAHHHCPA